tara:strand:- start:4714 stop:5013 length:300 start_codon:yes stop_codon:yes gene_type:complete
MIVKTEEDGWGCVPELKEVVSKIESLDSYKYEINNCVRSSGLKDMAIEMKELLEEAIVELENIDTSIEYETVDCGNCCDMEMYGGEECPDCGREAEYIN